ncbi:MAG: hypothetical protein WC505_06735 [Patescibacteria group bacterium]
MRNTIKYLGVEYVRVAEAQDALSTALQQLKNAREQLKHATGDYGNKATLAKAIASADSWIEAARNKIKQHVKQMQEPHIASAELDNIADE